MPRAKVGWRREDAAMDAMKQFGFPASLVKKKLKELLNIYGDGGWIFIEEASYKLLIEVILEAVQNEEHGESPTLLLTNGDVAESSASVPANANAPHNSPLDAADGPNESLANQVSAQSSFARLNKDAGDEGESISKERIVGDCAQYAGAEYLRNASNVPLGVATSLSTGQTTSKVETLHPKAAGTFGVNNPVEPRTNGRASISKAADTAASQTETDVRTSEFQCTQACSQTVKRSRKRSYGWFDNSDEVDVIDTTQFTSYKITSELSGGTKTAKGSKRWDLKPGTWLR